MKNKKIWQDFISSFASRRVRKDRRVHGENSLFPLRVPAPLRENFFLGCGHGPR